MNKAALRAAILRQLESDLATQTNAATLARDEAISEESRPENKWDTHSQEAAYLAEGQAKLAAEVAASIEIYTTLPLPEFSAADPVALGAIVDVEAKGGAGQIRYFLGPRAGGLELILDGQAVLVLTPQSPLGRQLVGKQIGDTIHGPGKSSGLQRIVAVC